MGVGNRIELWSEERWNEYNNLDNPEAFDEAFVDLENTEYKMEFKHLPVMLWECIDGLNVKEDGIYVDCTLGGGGHSLEIVKKLKTGRLICIDKDADAILASAERLKEHKDKITFVHDDFKNIKTFWTNWG